MAAVRINMDTSLLTDPRVASLIREIGDAAKAYGILYLLFIEAMEHWYPNKELIPKDRFKFLPNYESLLRCELVEERETGFYVKGSKERFEWRFTKQENGRKGGIAKASAAKRNSSLANQSLTKSNEICPLPLSSSSKNNVYRENSSLGEYTSELASPPKGETPALNPHLEEAKLDSFCQEFRIMWNALVHKLPTVPFVAGLLRTQLGVLLQKYPDCDWEKILSMVNESDYLNGRVDPRFTANALYITRLENFDKLVSGGYSSKRNENIEETKLARAKFIELKQKNNLSSGLKSEKNSEGN